MDEIVMSRQMLRFKQSRCYADGEIKEEESNHA